MTGKNLAVLAGLLLLCPAGTHAARGEVTVLGAWYRADTPFPEFMPLWYEGISDRDPILAGERYATEGIPLGSSIHVYLHNGGGEPAEAGDILFEGTSLSKAVASDESRGNKYERASSIFFGDLSPDERQRLISAGEPVWWRIDPAVIPAGGVAEAVVRLRGQPVGPGVRVSIVAGEPTEEMIVAADARVPRIAGISFGAGLDEACVYFRHPKGGGVAPSRILVDGRDATGRSTVKTDGNVDIVPAVVRFREPLAAGSYHLFQGVYADGGVAWGGLRAWHFDFPYGIWGSRPGKEGETEKAREYVRDIHAHNMNVQMEMVGSAAVSEFLKSDEGLGVFAELGLRRMVSDPGKGNVRDPFAYFLMDEPDAHDYNFTELDLRRRVGAHAQWLVERSARIRREDPVTPHLLNVDVTFKPQNWPMYGQLPDILATDPYYTARLRQCYDRHAERLPLFLQPTIIYAVAAEAQAAAAPRPTHVILYSVRHTRDEIFRYPTPEEKRIEVYYSIGAGAKGISYWWYSPVPPAYGVGGPEIEARELWNEIGLLGAEVRTAGPVLGRSCPAAVPATGSPHLWTRSLLAGVDTVVLVCVNSNHANDRAGTVYQPIEDAVVKVRIPSWIESPEVFEVSWAGTRRIASGILDGAVALELGRVDLTRLIVITADTELRARLQDRYAELFAERAAALRREPDTRRRP